MATDDGLLDDVKRRPRLPIILGIALFACALAFWWVAMPPLAQRTGPTAQRPAQPSAQAAPERHASAGRSPAAPGAASRSGAGPTGAPGRVTVSVMTLGNELTPEQIAQFEALNPDTRIVFLEYSSNLLDILMATNDLPDVFRVGQVEHEPLIQRGLLLDVTDRIAGSKVLSLKDLRAESVAEVAVDGRFYGLPQGFGTPDFTSLYINTKAFAEAGVALPSLKESLTYAELAAIARRLTAKTGRPAFYSFFFERAMTAALAQAGARMFNDDFSEMTLIGNAKALEVVRYFYDLAQSGAMYVPPATPAIAFKFENDELPISQSGYWMGAVVKPGTRAFGHVTMLPAPVWSRSAPRVSYLLGGTKLVISSASTHPDEAYRFIEWYTTGKPAVERARRGWDFPLLRSMEPLLPRETEFDRQRLRVAQDAMKSPRGRLPVYPHETIIPAFNQSWTRNMALARSGKIGFAEFASNLQEDVNLAIQDDVTNRHADASAAVRR